jgi:hypothetical protein
MNVSIRLFCLLVIVIGTTGCDRLVPANQKMMKDAIKASDQAVRSEEKTWAMVLRIEELSLRLEKAVEKAEAAAVLAEKAASDARQATLNTDQAKVAATQVEEQALRAENAARQAEEALRRIEAQEGESLQKMLEFMRELGYKP